MQASQQWRSTLRTRLHKQKRCMTATQRTSWREQQRSWGKSMTDMCAKVGMSCEASRKHGDNSIETIVKHGKGNAKNFDTKAIETTSAMLSKAVGDCKAVCEVLSKEEEAFADIHKVRCKAKVSIARRRLVELSTSQLTKDKVKLRRSVLLEMAQCLDKKHSTETAFWQKQLLGALRIKVDRAIKMLTL